MKIKHPLAVNQERLYPIQAVLQDLAAQENCDGEPYDQMQAAAEYIKDLETLLKNVSGILYIVSLRPNGKLNTVDLTEINELRAKINAIRS
jgi:hypothetical protein